MSSAYAQWFAQIEQEYGEQLAQMPLPDGLPEHVEDLMRAGDREALLFMLKVAWQMGAQAGVSAGMSLAKQGQVRRGNEGTSTASGGLKA